MIAVDTNVLVYAHRSDSPMHARAAARLKALANDGGRWAIPWPCVHEFLAIVTHPRIYRPPSPVDRAVEFIRRLSSSSGFTFLTEGPDHLDTLSALLHSGDVAGAKVHDARVAAICLESGVRTFWTLDRDFSRFPALRTENPLS